MSARPVINPSSPRSTGILSSHAIPGDALSSGMTTPAEISAAASGTSSISRLGTYSLVHNAPPASAATASTPTSTLSTRFRLPSRCAMPNIQHVA